MSRSPFAAYGDGDGRSRLWRSQGNGWHAIDSWDDSPQHRRMPYALLAFAERANRLLVGLRGGILLVTDDRGESWSELPFRLPGLIDLATVPA